LAGPRDHGYDVAGASEEVRSRSPPVHVYFRPTSASWMNLVKVWFGIIERQALHRIIFGSVHELNTKIHNFVDG
jgi:hypothetical protein